MLDAIGIPDGYQAFIYMMLSFAFVIGLMLTVSQESFEHFRQSLEREYGYKKRLFPNIENIQNHFIDWLVLKYRTLFGLFIVISAFVLLLLFK
jgi:hypothetical protein